MTLTEVGPELWIAPTHHRILGIDARRQMVMARLRDGSLWIHTPPHPTPEVQDVLAGFGTVRHVVGPSLWHDECLAEFQAAFPDAVFHGAPGLAQARKDVRFAHELGDEPPAAWAGTMEQHLVRGMPRMNEIVFWHRPARALILADLAMNIQPPAPWFTRQMFRLAGAWRRFGPTRFCRSLMNDRPAVRASIDRILRWDFDTVVVGHGANVTSNGREALRAAFSFLHEGG